MSENIEAVCSETQERGKVEVSNDGMHVLIEFLPTPVTLHLTPAGAFLLARRLLNQINVNPPQEVP